MPGMVKVGFSNSDPLGRARDLDKTGTPQPYVVEHDVLVVQAQVLERRIHKRLSAVRERGCREWFRCSPQDAIAAVRAEVGIKAIADITSPREVVERDAVALEKERLMLAFYASLPSEEASKRADADLERAVANRRQHQARRDAHTVEARSVESSAQIIELEAVPLSRPAPEPGLFARAVMITLGVLVGLFLVGLMLAGLFSIVDSLRAVKW